MPQTGVCADSKCDREIKRLYECHCCLQSICLNHLNEHDEKDKSHCLTEELRTKTDTIRSSIDNRLKIIERETIFMQQERKFLGQANHLLDGQHHPIGDIQKILEEFNQIVQINNFECIVKVEPMLADVTNNNMISVELKPEINLDLTQDSENEYSISDDQNISPNLSDNSFQDNYENEKKGFTLSSFTACCPLTFNGAYGIRKSKHSIPFCSDRKQRPIKLYTHFIRIHRLKPTSAQCLINAMSKNCDPRTTKLFDNNEDIIDHSFIIECPFKNGTLHFFDCQKVQNIRQAPCKYQTVFPSILKLHLTKCHRLSKDLAQQLAQYYKDNRIRDH